ncbi:MAG: hypothetical protein NZ870_04770, partial [bacterium]|nr:hypothetical protein [bacterium]
MNIEVVFIKKFRNKVPGDVANVKLGFARNYLIPKGYAVVATGYNLRVINSVIERKKKELEAKLERLKKIVKELNMKEFVFNLRSEGD